MDSLARAACKVSLIAFAVGIVSGCETIAGIEDVQLTGSAPAIATRRDTQRE